MLDWVELLHVDTTSNMLWIYKRTGLIGYKKIWHIGYKKTGHIGYVIIGYMVI